MQLHGTVIPHRYVFCIETRSCINFFLILFLKPAPFRCLFWRHQPWHSDATESCCKKSPCASSDGMEITVQGYFFTLQKSQNDSKIVLKWQFGSLTITKPVQWEYNRVLPVCYLKRLNPTKFLLGIVSTQLLKLFWHLSSNRCEHEHEWNIPSALTQYPSVRQLSLR